MFRRYLPASTTLVTSHVAGLLQQVALLSLSSDNTDAPPQPPQQAQNQSYGMHRLFGDASATGKEQIDDVSDDWATVAKAVEDVPPPGYVAPPPPRRTPHEDMSKYFYNRKKWERNRDLRRRQLSESTPALSAEEKAYLRRVAEEKNLLADGGKLPFENKFSKKLYERDKTRVRRLVEAKVELPPKRVRLGEIISTTHPAAALSIDGKSDGDADGHGDAESAAFTNDQKTLRSVLDVLERTESDGVFHKVVQKAHPILQEIEEKVQKQQAIAEQTKTRKRIGDVGDGPPEILSPKMQAIVDRVEGHGIHRMLKKEMKARRMDQYTFPAHAKFGVQPSERLTPDGRLRDAVELPESEMEKVWGLERHKWRQICHIFHDFDYSSGTIVNHVCNTYPYATYLRYAMLIALFVGAYELQLKLRAVALYDKYFGLDIGNVPTAVPKVCKMVAAALVLVMALPATQASIFITRVYRIIRGRHIGPP